MWDWYSRSASPAVITRNYDWPRRESATKNIQNNSWTLKCIGTDLALGAHSHITCFQAVRALQELFNPSHDSGTASMLCLSPLPPTPAHPQGQYNRFPLKTITILDFCCYYASLKSHDLCPVGCCTYKHQLSSSSRSNPQALFHLPCLHSLQHSCTPLLFLVYPLGHELYHCACPSRRLLRMSRYTSAVPKKIY